MIDSTDTVYIENKTKFPWSIGLGTIYDENQIGQRCDKSSTCGLYKKETELSWLIGPSAVCDKNQIGQWHDWSYMCSLHRKW